MRILHYSLGFPPYRSGGLTKFCMDLMREQVNEGHDVSLLWPGEIKLINHKVCIKKRKAVDSIGSYEIINPLPVSFDEGISDIDSYTANGDRTVYYRFLKKIKPDVIHFHTLMGLHKSFIKIAKKCGIRLVFTSHDFFPICPKVTLFKNDRICDSIDTCEECSLCNKTALSIKKITILQSPLYRCMKDSRIVRRLRKQHRDEFLTAESIQNNNKCIGNADDYIRLRSHYRSMLSLMDIIHYNSSVTKKVYEHIFGDRNNCVISITHSDIANHKVYKTKPDNLLRIRYLGPQGKAKGFYMLIEALDMLWKERKDFCLDIHFVSKIQRPYIRIHNRYDYHELKRIFSKTDLLVAPSLLYETFGYTVLEALSYGVPVIMSDNVGAKDILADGAGVVIDSISSSKLYFTISGLMDGKTNQMNRTIVDNQRIKTIKEMSNQLIVDCYKKG